MQTVTYKKVNFDTDDNGYLLNYGQFCREWVEFNAFKRKLLLTENHWDVLHFVTSQFKKNGEVPSLREICKGLGKQSSEVLRLFPGGYKGILQLTGHRPV